MHSDSSSTGPLRRLWILGFAGHRTLGDPGKVAASIRHSVAHFRKQVGGDVIGRVSAAAGADLLFLEACRDEGLAYSVVLPFPEDRFREDFEDDAEWSRAKSLIDGAASVEIAPGHEGAPEAYHLASREIIDVADAMIFVWDGKPARGIGGTGETVEDARNRQLPHQIIDATSGEPGLFETTTPFPWTDPVFSNLPVVDDLDALFLELDQRALLGAPKSRMLAAGSITLNQAATLVSAIMVIIGFYQVEAPAVRFVIVVIAAFLPWLGSGKRLQENWLNNRRHSELLRSLLASHAFSPPLRPFAADLFISDLPFLRAAAWRLTGNRKPWTEERECYLTGRLDEQIDYMDSKGSFAAKRFSRFQVLFRVSSIGAMVLGAVAIVNAISDLVSVGWIDSVFFKFLPTILPALAAWSLSMIALFEYKRRAGLYLQLAARLRKKRGELIGAKSVVTAANVVASCERLLLTELWEWNDRGKLR